MGACDDNEVIEVSQCRIPWRRGEFRDAEDYAGDVYQIYGFFGGEEVG